MPFIKVFFVFSNSSLKQPTPPLWPPQTSLSLLFLGFVQATAKLHLSNFDCKCHLLQVYFWLFSCKPKTAQKKSINKNPPRGKTINES